MPKRPAYIESAGSIRRAAGNSAIGWASPIGPGGPPRKLQAVVAFAFDALGAEKLSAGWFHDNPASGRVLEKLGCVPDGNDERSCLSRGTNVFCHKVVLKRADYELRKAIP